MTSEALCLGHMVVKGFKVRLIGVRASGLGCRGKKIKFALNPKPTGWVLVKHRIRDAIGETPEQQELCKSEVRTPG